jgi:hypothetical protein
MKRPGNHAQDPFISGPEPSDITFHRLAFTVENVMFNFHFVADFCKIAHLFQ